MFSPIASPCWEIRQRRWFVCWIKIRNSQVEAFPRSILVIPTVPGPWRRVPVPFLLVRCQWGRKNNHQVMLLLLLMKVPLTLSVSYANSQATSARAFSHQWTDLTSTQWHTAFTDLTSVGQISPHPNGTPQETKSDLANYAIPMSTIPLRSAIPEFKKASCFRCISRSSSQWHTG